MDSIEIENIEKLLQELEATSNLLLVDEGGSPKQFNFHKDNEKLVSEKAILNSYEFLSSYDLRDAHNVLKFILFTSRKLLIIREELANISIMIIMMSIR